MTTGVVNKHSKGGWIIAKFNTSANVALNHIDPLIGANSAGETVTSMNIVSAEWSIGNNAYWVVNRGSNTCLILTDGQHVFDMADGRIVDGLGGDPQANIAVTKVGAGPGTLILKIHKVSSITGGSQY